VLSKQCAIEASSPIREFAECRACLEDDDSEVKDFDEKDFDRKEFEVTEFEVTDACLTRAVGFTLK
jgi:hypothetical protein